jgi:hypothetical protein
MYEAIAWLELMVKLIVLASLLMTTLLIAPPSAGALPSATPGPVYVLCAMAVETAKVARAETMDTGVLMRLVVFFDLLIRSIMS